MKNIIENINYYKSRSANRLQSEQLSYIPYLEKDQIECTVNTYFMSGKRYIINQYNHLCIRLKYLKYRPGTYRKRNKYNNLNTPMITLVDEDIIQPFALFVDGRFIPWDIISISICQNSIYLLIDISRLDGKFKNIIGLKNAQILTLPEYVKYSTNEEKSNYNVLFSFNDVGEFSTDNVSYSLIIKKDPHICTSYINTYDNISALDVSSSFKDIKGKRVNIDKCKLFNENVFLFVNGLFSVGEKDNIKRGTDWDYLDHRDDDFNDFSPKIQLVQSDETLPTNPDIRFDKDNLTINNGKNESSDKYDIIICINTDYSNSIDNIINAENSFVQPIAASINDTGNSPIFYDRLNTPFEMDMDRNIDYSSNVANAIRTMLAYNSNVFKDVFYKTSNLEIIEKSGSWVNSTKKNTDNTLWIPRKHNGVTEEFIIMLVNGRLYTYHHAIKYKANYCIIPITGINDDDKIEFLKFKNVNNNIFDITVGEPNSSDPDYGLYYSSDIINDNLVLFSNEASYGDSNSIENAYTYPIDGDQHFPINFSIETDSDNVMKIILEDTFYTGKQLKAAYKNRYVHAQYKVPVNDTNYTQFSIDLGDKFAFCNDYNKFMIFLNGCKLDSDHYRLVLPVRTTTPFYEFKLYLATPISEGDNIDVIYTPSIMKDIVYTPNIDISGSIVVDKSILNYGIGTDLFMVWVNGRKVPSSNIIDIGANRMHIISDELSTKNLCITKYIPDIEILINDFQDQLSTWDWVISRLSNEEICDMLGITPEGLTNHNPDINEGSVSIKSIMHEIIREWYLSNPRVDTTKTFVYDYTDVDKSAIDSYDSSGNIIIAAIDANHTENVDGTVWSE